MKKLLILIMLMAFLTPAASAGWAPSWGQKDSLVGSRVVKKTITFDGATTNAIGDFNGTGEPHSLFTVTGVVLLRIIAVCTTSLTIDATATLEVGVSGSTAKFIAQEAGDAIDVNEIWHDTTSDSTIEALSVSTQWIVTNGQDVIATTATANINTGVIDYYAFWEPISAGAKVVAA